MEDTQSLAIEVADSTAELVAVKESRADALFRAALNKITVVVDMLLIETAEDLENANDILRQIKAVGNMLEEEWRPRIDAAHKAHKVLTTDYNKRKKPVDALEERVKRVMTEFLEEQKRQRQRLEREAARLAEQQRQLAEAEAAKLLKQGKVAESHEVQQVAQAMSVSIIAPPPIKLDGTTGRTVPVPTIDDFLALVKGVAAGQVPLEALLPNEKFLKAQAKAFGKNLNYPGVRVEEKMTLATSAKEW